MFSRLQDLMQWRASLLMSGKFRELAEEYLYPLPVYLGGRQQVLRNKAEMETALRRLSVIAKSSGITRIDATVRALELPRAGRFRVWISHRDFGPEGQLRGGGQFVHYCRLTDLGIKTEMSDYPDCRADWISTEPQRALA